jgi:hypothetical protein
MSTVNHERQTRTGEQDGGVGRRLRQGALPLGPDGSLFPLLQNGSWYEIEPRFARYAADQRKATPSPLFSCRRRPDDVHGFGSCDRLSRRQFPGR